MILLKKVLTVVGQDLDLERGEKATANTNTNTNAYTKRIERRKSNLVLHVNDDDELDVSRTCPICLSEYEDGERICWSYNTQCAHHFHAQCGIAWLARHTECPICRADYLVEPTEDQQEVNDVSIVLQEPPVRSLNPITIIEEEEDVVDDDDDDNNNRDQDQNDRTENDDRIETRQINDISLENTFLHENTQQLIEDNINVISDDLQEETCAIEIEQTEKECEKALSG